MIGEMINGYKIIDHLGSGAFGNTYKVEKQGNQYALKLLKPEAINPEISSGGFKRFQREIRSLQKVNSDYVVKYIDDGVWVDNNIEHFYLIMEYVIGKDLDKFLKTEQKKFISDENLMRDIFAQILNGLYDMHEIEIIHRDLKPSNIFITESQKIKLLDFGLVKMLDYSSITTKGKLVGTPFYMSPEIIQGKQPDYRSDLYSFGVMVYKIMTGEFPFSGENVYVLLNNIVTIYPKKPTEINKNISNAFENIILRLLEKQPYLRPFRNALELLEILKEIPLLKKEIEYSRTEDKSFSKKKYFIRLIHNEKTELSNYIKSGGSIDGIEYPANYLPQYKNQIEDFKKYNVPFYFDPSTNRLAYSKFSETKGLKNLPYVYDKFNKLTPKKLSTISQMEEYVTAVLNWQIEWSSDWVVAPFHYSKNIGDEWLGIDLKLLEETKRYIKENAIKKEFYAGVCIDIEELTDEDNRLELVNRYSKILPDGFIFYVNNIYEKTTNESQLYGYIDLLLKFKRLNRPVIAARVGNLGLGLLYLKIDSFSSGIASLSSFSEEMLLSDRPSGYNMERKYYIPQLLFCFDISKVMEILREEASLICNCKFCNGKIDIPILTKYSKQHFLEIRNKEIREINNNPQLPVFLLRVDKTIKLFKKLNKKFHWLQFKHLESWYNVFHKFMETNKNEI